MYKKIVRTPITFTNGKKAILEEMTYEFCPDLWGVIKEFAGIYNHNIEWDKILMKNQSHILQKMICFTNPDNGKEMPACHFKKNEAHVRKQFWEKVNKGDFKQMPHYYQEHGAKKFDKKLVLKRLNEIFGVWTLPKEFQVGDEIWFYRANYAGDQYIRAGEIISIAKDRKSYKLKEYSYGEQRYDEKYDNSYDTHYIYDWDKTNTKLAIIKSDKGIEKGLEIPTYTSYYR